MMSDLFWHCIFSCYKYKGIVSNGNFMIKNKETGAYLSFDDSHALCSPCRKENEFCNMNTKEFYSNMKAILLSNEKPL